MRRGFSALCIGLMLALLAACASFDKSDSPLAIQSRGQFLSASVGTEIESQSVELEALAGDDYDQEDFPGFVPLVGSGVAVGLGNDDYVVEIVADGEAVFYCENRGGNFAPGVSLPFLGVGLDQLLGDAETRRNGRDAFAAELEEDALNKPDPAEVCQNRNWDVVLAYIDYQKADLTLFKDGEKMDSLPFSCDTTFENGHYSVSCEEE